VTEAELREHRRGLAVEAKAEAEKQADKDAWTFRSGAPMEFVDRGAVVSNREAQRAQIAEMVALRITGHTLKEIAEHCECSEDTVRRYLALAADTAERNDVGLLLDYHAVPLAVDNLITGLKAGDKQYTLKVLEGRGHLQKHTRGTQTTQAKGGFTFAWVGAPQTAPALPAGAIQGIERVDRSVVDAEVIDDDK
jgi:hypothetical protein